jgi:hypothetical protein
MFNAGRLPLDTARHAARRFHRPDRSEFWLANRLAAVAMLAALGGVAALVAIPVCWMLSTLI